MAHPTERARGRLKLAAFLILVTLFSAAIGTLQAIVPSGSRLFIVTWTPLLVDAIKMWSVGLAGVIALLMVDHSLRDIGLRRCNPWYVALAAVVPLTYCCAIYVPVWISGVGGFRGGTYLLSRAAAVPFHLLLGLLLAAGEEIGWRGVLVPNLARVSGFAMTAGLPGAIWAVWHYPDILFFGYNGHTEIIFALCCFSISLIGLGMFLTWLRLTSDSVWPAVVFHAVHNTLFWGVFERATENKKVTAYITTEFGVGLSIVAAAIGYICWANRASAECAIRTPDQSEKEDEAELSPNLGDRSGQRTAV